MSFGQGQRIVLLLAGLVVVVFGLHYAQPLLVPLTLAIVIATVSAPLIHWMMRKKVPRGVAVGLTMLINLAVLVGLGTLVVSSLRGFYDALPRYQASLSQMMRTNLELLESYGIQFSSKDMFDVSSDFGRLVNLLGGLIKQIANAVSTALFVMLLVGFILAESGTWGSRAVFALGAQRQEVKRYSEAIKELQKYLAVKTAANAVTGILCGVWAAIMGIDFPVLWGLITMLLNYIPTVGTIIAAVPPILLAGLAYGPGTAAITAVGFVLINATLGSVVEPRIMGRALGLSPLVVLVSMVFWWWIWGPVGALLSAPLTMMTKILLSVFEDLRWISILLGSNRWVETMRGQWTGAGTQQNNQPQNNEPK